MREPPGKELQEKELKEEEPKEKELKEKGLRGQELKEKEQANPVPQMLPRPHPLRSWRPNQLA